jgi:tripartite-type tricarboxylate transporter receptor subunit TctC
LALPEVVQQLAVEDGVPMPGTLIPHRQPVARRGTVPAAALLSRRSMPGMDHHNYRLTRRALCALGGAALCGPLRAQPRFPERPISLLVPFAPGGIADLTARAVAEEMARSLGQPVVVENKPSAGSVVASSAVATARPDGHTLLLMSNATAVSTALFRSLPFDPLRDFAPVSMLGAFGLAILVAPASRFPDLAGLVRFAREQPGRLTVGTIAIGSTQNLAAELFRSSAGLDFQIVPFNGTPALLTAVLGGHVDAAFEIVGPAIAQTGPKSPRVLAVTSERRSPLLPDVPTVSETVLPGYRVTSWNALAAPARTPPEVIARLNEAVRHALAAPAVTAQLRQLGVDPRPGAPEDLARLLAGATRRWAEVIERARIERQ